MKYSFTNKDEPVDLWTSSLSHHGDEVYISSIKDIRKVLDKLFAETNIRIFQGEMPSKGYGFIFNDVDEIDLNLFRYHGKKLVQVTEKLVPLAKRMHINSRILII
jgi:hypothetical protein